MYFALATPTTYIANASAASDAMRSFVTPALTTIIVLASLACAFFLITGGFSYMASKGNPQRLEQAKKVIKNALIGLALVIAAGTLTAILSHAYSSSGTPPTEKLPQITQLESKDSGIGEKIAEVVTGFLRTAIQQMGEPFINALGYFTNSTPLMAENSNVFNIWLAIVGITDVVFILVVALLGFQIMSSTMLGFEEIDIKQLLPQLAFIFLLINSSIFAIDAVISLSNGMIYALRSAFQSTDIWATLAEITTQSAGFGLAGLLVMAALLILTVRLLVYYVGRLITLYLGAILSPLIALLWLIPAFKDFAMTALKTYLTTIFVLFVHVVILLLAASIFTSMLEGDNGGQPNAMMALIVGLATLLALLNTQSFMRELSYAASTPRAAREVAGSFMKGVAYLSKTSRASAAITEKVSGATTRASRHLQSRNGRKSSNINQASSPSSKSPSQKTNAPTPPLSSKNDKPKETKKANSKEKQE